MPTSYPSGLTEMMAAMQLQPDLPSGASCLEDAYALENHAAVPTLLIVVKPMRQPPGASDGQGSQDGSRICLVCRPCSHRHCLVGRAHG